MVNKKFYNTFMCLTFTPCGNYLVAGDIYGQISVIDLNRLMNPDTNITKQDLVPKNIFTVHEDIQINSLLSIPDYLLVGVLGDIYGFDWKVVKNNPDAKIAWKIEMPNNNDSFNRAEINCLSLNKASGLLYAGCGDNNIYVININTLQVVQTLCGHSDYVHNIFNFGNDLVSGGEDGVVNLWDLRDRKLINKLEPYKNDDIARPHLGKWIGAVCVSDDWLLCGGGPKLSLWHFRSLTASTIFPIEDNGIHVAHVLDDTVIAGGRSKNFYNMTFNGEIVSKIQTSSPTVYSAAYQEQPFRALCLGGSSPKIDICSNFTYKDQVLNLM